MLQLNDHCLGRIIEYLDLWDQIHFIQAYPSYCNILQVHLKTDYKLELKLLKQRTSSEIKELFEMIGQNIEEITGFVKYLNLNEIILMCIIEYCPNVKRLSFRHVPEYNIEQYISKFSPKLFIDDGYNCGMAKLIKLLEHFKNITALHLFFGALCDETIAKFPYMHKLEILGVPRNLDLTGKYLSKFVSVTELNLYGNRNLQCINFIEICKSLKELKKLNLLYCNQLSEAFNAIADNCKNLENLTVSCKDNDTEAVHLARLPKLKRLSLHSIAALKSQILSAFAENNSTLETLNIQNTKCSIEQVTQIGRITSLKELHCPRSNNLTDDCLMEISKLPNLEKLHIWNCQSLTNVGVLEVLGKCCNLNYINIGSCHSITADLVFDAIEILKSRQLLPQEPILFLAYNTKVTALTQQDPRYKAAASLMKLKI